MRKKVIAGNWKMHMNLNETIQLISGIKNNYEKNENVNVIICPPYTSLETAKELLKKSGIKLGAQNFYHEPKGAFTGEISADMLKSVGCEYVIVGHSERRTIFGETDSEINKKIKRAIESGLFPIFCIGENLEQRENGSTFKIIENQLTTGFQDISQEEFSKIIIAYEPVWAIGTGKTATPQQAQEVHEFIRKLISSIIGQNSADSLIIQYGGSVKPENANSLLTQPDIDGALVGGACLLADSFLDIVKAAQ